MSENPNFIFHEAGGVPCELVTVAYDVTANATTFSLATAVAGKRTRVVSVVASSVGAQTWVSLYSGATTHLVLTIPANGGVSPNVILPFNPAGWATTGTNAALLARAGAVNISLSITYAVYTPVTG